MANKLINKARKFATDAHVNQYRRGNNQLYINHPRRVVENIRKFKLSNEAIAAAWLHDVLEDTTKSIKNFPKRTQEIVDLLTRKKDENKLESLERLAKSKDIEAIIIKVADRCDNLEGIMNNLDLNWLKRYLKTSYYILNIGKENNVPGINRLSALIGKAEILIEFRN